MKKNVLWKLAKGVLLNSKNESKETTSQPTDTKLRLIEKREFIQSSSFRGFRRYKLTIFEQPGVAEGIEHFRDTKDPERFIIEKEAPISLMIKDGGSYKLMEVYVDNHKVGVLYSSRDQYDEILSNPFDKVYVRIDYPETIIHKDGIEYRPIVYLFVHYIDV